MKLIPKITIKDLRTPEHHSFEMEIDGERRLYCNGRLIAIVWAGSTTSVIKEWNKNKTAARFLSKFIGADMPTISSAIIANVIKKDIVEDGTD